MQAMTIETRWAPSGRRPAQCPCFPFGAKGGKHRPRHQAKVTISVQQDQDQRDGRMEVTVEPQDGVTVRVFGSQRPTLVRISVLDVPLQNGRCWRPSRSIFGKRIRASINRTSHQRGRGRTDRVLIRERGDLTHPSSSSHQLKNTSREAVLPLYCSSLAPEAIHHTLE